MVEKESTEKSPTKLKRKAKVSVSEPTNMKVNETVVKSPPKKKPKKKKQTKGDEGLTPEQISEKYPILKNEDLVKKFLSVNMTNNQKGRIRQLLKDNLLGTSESLLPDVIHNRIQSILKSSENLTDTDLRKIRILYNMLKTALGSVKTEAKTEKKDTPEKDGDKVKKVKKEKEDEGKKEVKVKGPKRYVVFVGNLPLDVNKEMIMSHFSILSDHIKDIRIPKTREGKKSAIAYVELANEPTYELALSKHHSMLANKRINVLYTTQKNGKITKAQAKSKSAKLIALQKSGKLLGSVPLNRKRSHRRNKLKRARAKEAAAENA